MTADSPRHEIDALLFASSLVRVGRWRCPADHPQFRDSGPASETLFVFPRVGVWIEHEAGHPFVADANIVTYYNRGQRYRRARLSARGDWCDWFAVAPDVLADTLATMDPAAADRPERPFPFQHGPSDRESYVRQRMVFEHVSREPTPDRLFVEESTLTVLRTVTRAAFERSGHTPAPRRARGDGELSEAAREVIARRYDQDLSLADIARQVGTSVFHLARVFKRRTGLSLHAYRTQLRLRAALERIATPGADLLEVALDLGFSSHSHFTDAFRRAFGTTPSLMRRGF